MSEDEPEAAPTAIDWLSVQSMEELAALLRKSEDQWPDTTFQRMLAAAVVDRAILLLRAECSHTICEDALSIAAFLESDVGARLATEQPSFFASVECVSDLLAEAAERHDALAWPAILRNHDGKVGRILLALANSDNALRRSDIATDIWITNRELDCAIADLAEAGLVKSNAMGALEIAPSAWEALRSEGRIGSEMIVGVLTRFLGDAKTQMSPLHVSHVIGSLADRCGVEPTDLEPLIRALGGVNAGASGNRRRVDTNMETCVIAPGVGGSASGALAVLSRR